jgi:hypothetical protein
MPFKVIEFSGNLYRAEKYRGENNTRANKHYNRSIPFHFFTTAKNELGIYRKYGTTYTKTWRAEEPLLLIDIMDVDTRKLLENHIDKAKLNVAFPMINDKVYRVSEDYTVHIDRDILKGICSLQHTNGRAIDGYYMKRQEGIPLLEIMPFHSEVGLCQHAFRKLKLVQTER